MESPAYKSKVFRIVDTTLTIIGETVFGVLFLVPVAIVVYTAVFTDIEGRLTFTDILIIIAFIAFLRSLIIMSISPWLLITLTVIAFLYAMFVGFGIWGVIVTLAIPLSIYLLLKIRPVREAGIALAEKIFIRLEMLDPEWRNSTAEKLMKKVIESRFLYICTQVAFGAASAGIILWIVFTLRSL